MTTLPPRVPIRPEMRVVEPYVPGPLPATIAAELGLAPEAIVKLDANENPYGPPPGVAAALADLALHRYPDAAARDLRAALAAHTGRPAEEIVCGNGSDEVLELLARLFLQPGDAVITCEPTFGMYTIAPRQHGATVVDAGRAAETFAVDPAAVRAATGPRTRLIFLCAPNNPTGTALPEADLRAILDDAPCVVVVDEAYAEIAGSSVLPLLDTYPHLVVLRTLSKVAGLAGLRLGYAVATPEIANALQRVRAPFNVNLAAQVAGAAALADGAWLVENAARLRAGRDRLAAGLGAMPGLHVYPPSANFVLVGVAGGQPAAEGLYAGLRARGILIRRYGSGALSGCLRISVGTEAENARLLEEVHALWPTS